MHICESELFTRWHNLSLSIFKVIPGLADKSPARKYSVKPALILGGSRNFFLPVSGDRLPGLNSSLTRLPADRRAPSQRP